jgi:hypothetical protein
MLDQMLIGERERVEKKNDRVPRESADKTVVPGRPHQL